MFSHGASPTVELETQYECPSN